MEISKQSGKVKEGRRMTEKEVEKAYKKMTESDAPEPVGKDWRATFLRRKCGLRRK